ncbi:MAG: hypothetical protein RLN97_10315 [Fulvivirga sp.]|uniref:hypothetical protein n=2 Tax=Fulvivirga sp. TaxID=1931237 RepID=UPI0032EBA0E0
MITIFAMDLIFIMRVIKEINKPNYRITVFNWNGKYLIKFEQGDLEQTFKISEFDVANEDDIYALLTDDFNNEVVKNFRSMNDIINKHFEPL